MKSTPREDLKKELQNAEFAQLYGTDQAKIELALALVAARSKLSQTQQEIATRLKVSQPYIARLERGDGNPTIGSIGGMLGRLGLRIRMFTEPLLSKMPPVAQPSGYAQSSTQTTLEERPRKVPSSIPESNRETATINSFSPTTPSGSIKAIA